VVIGNEALTSVSLIAAAVIIASVVLITLPGSAARARIRARRASRPNPAQDSAGPSAEPVGAGQAGN
jgi:hypothetical protein